MKDIHEMTMQEMLEVLVNSNDTAAKNVFKSKYCPGESVYVAHFCNETVSNINTSIRQSYKFRPKLGVVKEILFDGSEHPIKYKIIGMASNNFSEELVAKTEEECEAICYKLNQPRT